MNSKTIYDTLTEYFNEENNNALYYALLIKENRKARLRPFNYHLKMFGEHMAKRRVFKYLIKHKFKNAL